MFSRLRNKKSIATGKEKDVPIEVRCFTNITKFGFEMSRRKKFSSMLHRNNQYDRDRKQRSLMSLINA